MAATDAWQQDGFAAIAEPYLLRLAAAEGTERMIDGSGDLLTRKKGKIETAKKKLAAMLVKPSWLDAKSGEILL
jgi:hypothetical protein